MLSGSPKKHVVIDHPTGFRAVLYESIGLPTGYTAEDHPKEPAPKEATIPVLINGQDTNTKLPTVKKSTRTDPRFAGVTEMSGKTGAVIDIRKIGIISLPVGGIPVTAGQFVKLDNDPAGTGIDGDVIPDVEEDSHTHTFTAAYTANDLITLSRPITGILSGVFTDDSAGTSDELTVVPDGTLGANEISFVDNTHIRLGNDAAAPDRLDLTISVISYLTDYTVGQALQSGAARVATTDKKRIQIWLMGK